MANFKYNINELDPSVVNGGSSIPESKSSVIEQFAINNLFAKESNKLEIHVYSVDNQLLTSDQNFTKYTQLLNSAGAGKDGASNIYLDPVLDAKDLGYERGDVRLLYNFLDNLYTDAKIAAKFFIKEISSDRTELRLLTFELTDEQLKTRTDELKKQLLDNSYFSDFKLNFFDNKLQSVINIDTLQVGEEFSVVVKLAEPLPVEFTNNTITYIEEVISDSIYYGIDAEIEDDVITVPKLKGPNFGIELESDKNNPSQFFNYNELFSYPVTNSYYELRSLYNEAGAQLSIDHTDYTNFIHFSSAEERLRNFKYKLDLIHSYETSINAIESSSYSGSGVSGSKEYYENLIKGLVDNFDHYDNFLYFESGSKSWPKSTSTKPHINRASSHTSASAFFNAQIITASNYDNSNFDILTNTIPRFIREDSENEPYIMFIEMISQHFDNLWVYFKAVSDKYDTDNRLDFGLSKDLVKDAIESFGVKLFTGNQNSDNVFAQFVGEGIQTGSENITSMSIATSASFNSGSTALEHLQPVPKNDYQKEIQKRIYHNLPYLMKTKGTERGLRALLNCYGVPDTILSIKQHGGKFISSSRFFGPEYSTTTGSTEKIRLDNTGSNVSGSTLSLYSSIVDKDKKYTDDLHRVDIGFDISRGSNEFIDATISSSFDIDEWIGDPRDRYNTKYDRLDKESRLVLAGSWNWEDILDQWQNADFNWNDALVYARSPKGFVRLLNYFDSSLFRTIKQFLPARAKVNTGAVIQSHKLHRSKVQQVSASITQPEYNVSMSIASITGSQGGTFDSSGSFNYTTNYSHSILTPLGPATKNMTSEDPMFNGEFSGSLFISTDGEVGSNNPFLNLAQPNVTFDLTLFNLSLPLPPACVVALSASFEGNFFNAFSTGSEGDAISGSIQKIYPSSGSLSVGSLHFTHDFDTFEFFTLQANESYTNTFQGWYKQFPTGSVSNRITTNTNLTIYYENEATYGNSYYAVFD